MKQKQIYEFLVRITDLLQKKVQSEENTTLPSELKEYTKGQLYEARYILENIEEIIFKE